MTTLLQQAEATLPSAWYFDAEHYRRELDTIWLRDWLCVGHESAIAGVGDFTTLAIGDQSVIITRSEAGIRAFHNTCRHRGSRLCTAESGRFRNGRILCPYHTWTYDLDGRLLATPGRLGDTLFDADDFALYELAVENWRGFLFVCLDDPAAQSFEAFLGDDADYLQNWPLEKLRHAHTTRKQVACNWKVYWENFSECYHCPRTHPSLCRVMPLYRQSTANETDLPGWGREDNGAATTWTPDGQSTLPAFEGLTAAELETPVTFAEFTASLYIAAHRDYLRSVRILPRGPETTELIIDWYLPPGSDPDANALARIVDFPMQVVAEDAGVCELNQLGLHCRRHQHGTLVAQEQDLFAFHEWLRARLGESR